MIKFYKLHEVVISEIYNMCLFHKSLTIPSLPRPFFVRGGEIYHGRTHFLRLSLPGLPDGADAHISLDRRTRTGKQGHIFQKLDRWRRGKEGMAKVSGRRAEQRARIRCGGYRENDESRFISERGREGWRDNYLKERVRKWL